MKPGHDSPAESRTDVTASALSPALPRAAATTEAPTRPRNGTRRVVARGTFLLVFGGLLGLFGYALGPRLASSLHELQTNVAARAATR
jgi:hypothetical protein